MKAFLYSSAMVIFFYVSRRLGEDKEKPVQETKGTAVWFDFSKNKTQAHTKIKNEYDW